MKQPPARASTFAIEPPGRLTRFQPDEIEIVVPNCGAGVGEGVGAGVFVGVAVGVLVGVFVGVLVAVVVPVVVAVGEGVVPVPPGSVIPVTGSGHAEPAGNWAITTTQATAVDEALRATATPAHFGGADAVTRGI